MKIKVSVIIPAYNSEKTLKQCLNSVLNQDFKEYEVIVVNNNSTDKTMEIIKEFEKKDKKVRYLFEIKRGIGASRNTGERVAKGEIILTTDSDCIAPRNWIKRMVEALEGYDAVQGFQEAVLDEYWSRYKQMFSEEKYKNEGIKNPIGKVDTKNFAVRKDVLRKIGYTSRKYFSGNDTYISIKLAQNNFKLRFVKNIKVKHFHAESFKKVFGRKVRWGKWTAIIARDHMDFLKKTDFLEDTCQTPKSFFEFFPGLIGTIVRKGSRYSYYNLITGIAWRVGLLIGWLVN